MIEIGRLPIDGTDFSRYREQLLAFMLGEHAAACLDRLLEVEAKIVAISYSHGAEFGKGEAVYFIMPEDKTRVMVMNTDESKLTGADRGPLRAGGENRLMRYVLEDDLCTLARAAS